MTLTISLVHFKVEYKNPRTNKLNILELITRAAKQGAKIILGPEMSISGYSFSGRNDIAQYTEEGDSPFLQKLQDIATTYSCYICVGLALRDKRTDAYFNSAVVVGPDDLYLRYDKINGEIRWARPGEPTQSGYFDTPWGRVGVLICSDTYYDLMPRITALKGVDLLLIPANWPPSGLDPVELWRARALENGMAVAACNRTGRDLNMDCEQAESCLIAADGEVLFRKTSAESMVFNLTLPLQNGLLSSALRKKRLAGRNTRQYHSCYRNLNAVGDLTSFLELPVPTSLSVHCFIPITIDSTVARLSMFFSDTDTGSHPSLWILPPAPYSEKILHSLHNLSHEHGVWLLLQCSKNKPAWHLYEPHSPSKTWPASSSNPDNVSKCPQIDIGPARVALMDFAELRHPEAALASSKEGCDMVIASAESFTDETKLLCGARTINHLAVACCAPDGAGIWLHPEGHQRWGETLTGKNGRCSNILHTTRTRKKRFQDRVDFNQLLRI